jgi:hypothetical protein
MWIRCGSKLSLTLLMRSRGRSRVHLLARSPEAVMPTTQAIHITKQGGDSRVHYVAKSFKDKAQQQQPQSCRTISVWHTCTERFTRQPCKASSPTCHVGTPSTPYCCTWYIVTTRGFTFRAAACDALNNILALHTVEVSAKRAQVLHRTVLYCTGSVLAALGDVYTMETSAQRAQLYHTVQYWQCTGSTLGGVSTR